MHEWAEGLPPDCPPSNARPPQNEEFFRLVSDPPTLDDFVSNLHLYPNRFFNVGECVARSTSLWTDKQSCKSMRKWQRHRDKKVARLVLPPHSGMILRMRPGAAHVSWWRAKAFDPVKACKEVT